MKAGLSNLTAKTGCRTGFLYKNYKSRQVSPDRFFRAKFQNRVKTFNLKDREQNL